MNIETLSLHQTAVAIAACVRAKYVPLVIGSPGIGKTSLGRAITPVVAKALGYAAKDYTLATCILSNRDAPDVGGYPVVRNDDTVTLQLFGSLRDAALHPRLLLLDEFLTCPQAVQGPALRLVLEGVAGETALHPDTRIVAMANQPDHAPGGIQLTAALVNRLVILYCVPRVGEVAAYFCGRPEADLAVDLDLPDDAEQQARKAYYMDVAGILFEARPDLLQFEPPAASVSDGEPFASPRAWEICCSVLAALPEAHMQTVSDVTRAIVLGTIGAGAGTAYLTTLRARTHLPTVADVVDTPDTAALPDPSAKVTVEGRTAPIGRDVIFAAIPLVIEAARIDTWAAWVYAARLPAEITAAVAKSLTATIKTRPGSRWLERGQQTMLKVIGALAASSKAA